MIISFFLIAIEQWPKLRKEKAASEEFVKGEDIPLFMTSNLCTA